MGEKIVVALGGNAIIKQGQAGTVYEQFANTRASLRGIVELVKRGHSLVLTHGNGPQVGNILIRAEEARGKAYDLPLGVCVAQSQGEMGYMIQQSLQNALLLNHIERPVITVISQVVVSKGEYTTEKPTKPVGPFYSKAQAEALMATGLQMIEDSGRGYRRVVPSPVPYRVVEQDVIRRLLDAGVIVIAVGGGGIPVYLESDGRYEGVDAVVDKDLASAVLAEAIGAGRIIIMTGVEKVKLNFGSPQETELNHLTVLEAMKYMADGHFPPGSMGPKIQAAIRFMKFGGQEVIITTPEKLIEAFDGETGTHIHP
jgi:carbamate kinase